jgi:hypothetical protein
VFLALGLLFTVNALLVCIGWALAAAWAAGAWALQRGTRWLDRVAGGHVHRLRLKLALTDSARRLKSPSKENHPMPITPQEALQRTIEHREIFHDEMLHLMRMIMKGELSPVMTASITTGLRVKKETIGEITAAAQVMREFSTKVHVQDTTHMVDIVGTGGDGANTFNISTCAMFVIAAAGARSASTAGAACPASRQRRCDGGAGHCTSTCRPSRSPGALPRRASASCSRPTTTPP